MLLVGGHRSAETPDVNLNHCPHTLVWFCRRGGVFRLHHSMLLFGRHLSAEAPDVYLKHCPHTFVWFYRGRGFFLSDRGDGQGLCRLDRCLWLDDLMLLCGCYLGREIACIDLDHCAHIFG